MPDVIAPGTHALESGARREGGPLARRHGRAVLIINRCDRVALFVVPVAAKIAKLAAFEPMRRCAAKAVRALLASETMGRRSPSFGARLLARALKTIKSLRSPVTGPDQFAGRLVAASPVGNFAVPVGSEEPTSEP